MKVTVLNLTILFFGLFLLTSCDNDPVTFDDFDFSGTYFAWQYPVRTLVLGESLYYDNTNDINHQFVIKASMGGVYENQKDINVGFEIDPGLADSLAAKIGNDTVRLKILPSNYYEPITANYMVIPKGSFNGGITIKLTDAFFADSLSATTKYVLPVRIKSSETDSILEGIVNPTALISPISSVATNWGIDPRISSNWVKVPKNYTIYGIKYVNKYHGNYLRHGNQQEIRNGIAGSVMSYGLEKQYIEYTTYIPKLTTLSLNKILYADKLALKTVYFKAVLEVLSDNSVVIKKDPKSESEISGTGKYVTGVEEWGGKKRNAFYLNYTVINPANNRSYIVNDTLLIRDNAVAVETFSPIIMKK